MRAECANDNLGVDSSCLDVLLFDNVGGNWSFVIVYIM
jgi:hypothetical protein